MIFFTVLNTKIFFFNKEKPQAIPGETTKWTYHFKGWIRCKILKRHFYLGDTLTSKGYQKIRQRSGRVVTYATRSIWKKVSVFSTIKWPEVKNCMAGISNFCMKNIYHISSQTLPCGNRIEDGRVRSRFVETRYFQPQPASHSRWSP